MQVLRRGRGVVVIILTLRCSICVLSFYCPKGERQMKTNPS